MTRHNAESGDQQSSVTNQIADDLRKQIGKYKSEISLYDIGTVIEAGNGIARFAGLQNIQSQEVVQFQNGVKGIAYNLEKNAVGVIIMGDYSNITQGMEVRATGQHAKMPVGKRLIGRVVNALGEPVDGKGEIRPSSYQDVERIAPKIIERQPINTPLQTGILAIDSLIPIGQGQRELIIGDRHTGKTALAIDTIINQKGKRITCIYVAIGQKLSQVAYVRATLEKYGAMKHTIIVVASASEPAALQYLAPYAGCTIGEEVVQQGGNALIVYDDLTKHAWAYRQLSLLLRRSPGREAYPGDIFYLHSRLLERSVKRCVDDGGGSLTALPIIETQDGDVTAYIPTNIISITDGQIYLDSNLFNEGIRPAIDLGLSVSRIGSNAQTDGMKNVAGKLRLDMAGYRELITYTMISSDLEKSAQARLLRGQRLQEILKQEEYQPLSMENQVIVIFAGTNGYADNVPLDSIKNWKSDLLKYVTSLHPRIGKSIAEQKTLNNDAAKELHEILISFKNNWRP